MAKADFNLKAALNNVPLVTRDGRKVSRFSKLNDASGSLFRYSAIVDTSALLFTADGRYYTDNSDSVLDLFLDVEAPKQQPQQKQGQKGNLPGTIKTAEAQADANLDKLLRQLRTSGAPQSARNIIIKKLIKSLLNEL